MKRKRRALYWKTYCRKIYSNMEAYVPPKPNLWTVSPRGWNVRFAPADGESSYWVAVLCSFEGIPNQTKPKPYVRKIQTLKRISTLLLIYLYWNNSKCEKREKLLKDTSSYTAPLFSSPVWKALLLKRANSLHQVFFGQSSKRRLKDSLFRSRCCCKEGKKYVSILLKSSVNLSIT